MKFILAAPLYGPPKLLETSSAKTGVAKSLSLQHEAGTSLVARLLLGSYIPNYDMVHSGTHAQKRVDT